MKKLTLSLVLGLLLISLPASLSAQQVPGSTVVSASASGSAVQAPTYIGPPIVAGSVVCNFINDLNIGSQDASANGKVSALQKYLIAKGFLHVPNGVALGYFGNLTKNSLAAYQAGMGIYPSSGYFGALTRKFLATHCISPSPSPVSISSLSPSVGPVGSVVVINGSGFSTTGNTVNFGGQIIQNIPSSNGGTLSFNVPSVVPPPTPSSDVALNVNVIGPSFGTVRSYPSWAQLACGFSDSRCSAMYPVGTVVTLSANRLGDNLFQGWSGGNCSGTSPLCIFTITGSTTVTATFTGPVPCASGNAGCVIAYPPTPAPYTYPVSVVNANGATTNSLLFTVIPSNSNGGQNPIINGINAPTHLNLNETGTWTVSASDPLNRNLSYSVNWGDNFCPQNYSCVPTPSSASALIDNFQQSTSFSHAYSQAGIYNQTFTVRNSNGGEAQTSTTVLVGLSNS